MRSNTFDHISKHNLLSGLVDQQVSLEQITLPSSKVNSHWVNLSALKQEMRNKEQNSVGKLCIDQFKNLLFSGVKISTQILDKFQLQLMMKN